MEDKVMLNYKEGWDRMANSLSGVCRFSNKLRTNTATKGSLGLTVSGNWRCAKKKDAVEAVNGGGVRYAGI